MASELYKGFLRGLREVAQAENRPELVKSIDKSLESVLKEELEETSKIIDTDTSNHGMLGLVNSLIISEYDAIDQYNSAIATAQAQGTDDVLPVLQDIINEEQTHVGQLQELAKLFDKSAHEVSAGTEEAKEQLSDEGEEMSKLNEAIESRCNMNIPKDKMDIDGQTPIVYADAINKHQENNEQLKDSFKEHDKNTEEFIEQNDKRELKPKGTEPMKKLKLEESLFESYTVEPELHKQAIDISDYLEAFMNSEAFLDNDYFDDEDREAMGKTFDALNDFAHAYSTIMNDKNVSESVEKCPGCKKEVCECEKKELEEGTETKTRVRDPEPDWFDYSDTDLWLQVYDELDGTLKDEGGKGTVHRQLKAKRGERYTQIFPYGEEDIVIYETSPERFDFAKKVADFYGVKYEEPQMDKNKSTNSYYKWFMVIRIPKDAKPKKFD